MKKIILSIVAILLVATLIDAGTYAYFVFTINSGNIFMSSLSNIAVIYTKDVNITGELKPVSSYKEGNKATIKIKLDNDSVDAKADIYIYVDEIGRDIASNALKWELFRTYQGIESFVARGTFAGASEESKIYVDRDYRLNTEETSYTVYIWLDGSLTGNEVLGESLVGYIGAEAEHITELK